MYGRAWGIAVIGVRGHPVVVEAHIGRGLPSVSFTGLPGAAVHDARDRIRPAVESSGLEWPLRRIVVNLSPGNLRKDGPGLDLPVTVGVLAASGQVPPDRLERYALFGEVALEGSLVGTPGVLSAAIAAARAGLAGIVVPAPNAGEAALVENVHVVGVPTLRDAVAFLRGRWDPPVAQPGASPAPAHQVDFAEVRGQARARRALEVAAAGGHNVLLMGSPGAGKTMLARRLATILPALSRSEALEVTQLHSVAGVLPGGGLVAARPFRAPHHSISLPALLGGGTGSVRPGEVSMAHHGVLFLDELNEFRRDALEALRQPLEDGQVVVTRVAGSVEFPAGFTLAAAANPCPCGYDGDPSRRCVCPEHRVQLYRQKLSGPLLDRIDLRLAVPRLSRRELLEEELGEASGPIRDRVEVARAAQRRRYAELGYPCNAKLPGPVARRLAGVTDGARDLLAGAVDTLGLTGRGFDRAIKVARTVADLAGAARVEPDHVAEALSYRMDVAGEGLARAG